MFQEIIYIIVNYHNVRLCRRGNPCSSGVWDAGDPLTGSVNESCHFGDRGVNVLFLPTITTVRVS